MTRRVSPRELLARLALHTPSPDRLLAQRVLARRVAGCPGCERVRRARAIVAFSRMEVPHVRP